MKLYSSEIRWFSKDKIDLYKIYDALPGFSTDTEERTDYYLLTESSDLGIKLRGVGGRLEMKWLIDNRESFKISNVEIGIIESWLKTGFESHDPILNSVPKLTKNKENWIKIHKIRQKKKYEVLEQNKVVPLIRKTDTYTDCEVEFTKVLINDKQTFYTLGFESLVDKDKSRKYLYLTLKFCKDFLKPKVLKNFKSISYPELILIHI